MSKNLLDDTIVAAYLKRLENMNKYKFTEKGDELYISTLTAETEQIELLQVQTKINDLLFENDALKELGGSGHYATPMQMLLVSLASCLEISALLYFTFANVKINSLKVKVDATYDKRAVLNLKDAPLPGFYDYRITWYINTDEKQNKIKQVLKKVENNCPVRGSFERPNKFSEKVIIKNSQD